MLKIFAILALLYFFFRSVGHVVRMIFGSTVSRPQNPYSNQQKRRTTREGLHVDSIPNSKKSRKTDFKGGDYVDYEEVD